VDSDGEFSRLFSRNNETMIVLVQAIECLEKFVTSLSRRGLMQYALRATARI
jgi:hypothetical protein